MQAHTTARFEDFLAHVTFTGADSNKGSRQDQVPCYGTRPEYGTRGISHPREAGERLSERLRASPQQTDRC